MGYIRGRSGKDQQVMFKVHRATINSDSAAVDETRCTDRVVQFYTRKRSKEEWSEDSKEVSIEGCFYMKP